MARPELSGETLRRLAIVFPSERRAEAARLLVEGCDEALPMMRGASAEGLERIRFAALKLSVGDLGKLAEAIALARLDWRDLLMAADFDDVDAHRGWLA